MKARKNHSFAEGASFQTSILYWVGLLEERANLRMTEQLGEQRSVVARWRTLSILAELSGLPITQLGHHTTIQRSALSRLLDSMEEEGLVKRKGNPDNGRIIEVHITPKGRRKFEELLPIRRGIFKQAARGFTPEQLEVLLDNVRTLADNLAEDLRLPAELRYSSTTKPPDDPA